MNYVSRFRCVLALATTAACLSWSLSVVGEQPKTKIVGVIGGIKGDRVTIFVAEPPRKLLARIRVTVGAVDVIHLAANARGDFERGSTRTTSDATPAFLNLTAKELTVEFAEDGTIEFELEPR
jgi:hypothetical protein